MKQQYLFLKTCTERLIERAKATSDIGLWSGKMGTAIYLLHLARIGQNERYEEEASELIDAVYEKISIEKPFCLDDGLLGIGCGFEHIIGNGFMDADSDDILSEIDLVTRDIIDSRPIDDLSLGKGVCGVAFYLYCRLKKRQNDDDNMVVLKLKEYLIYLIDWVEDLLIETTNKEDYNNAYFLLCRLHKLNIFNHKVEKLAAFCLYKLIDSDYNMRDNYELLGIKSLKILKPWI